MQAVHRSVHRRGGVAATHELLADGHTSHQLTRAVRAGDVIRARQGHYCCPELDAHSIEAVRVGGKLSGLIAAEQLGLWAPAGRSEFSVAVPPGSRRLRTRTNPSFLRSAQPPKRRPRVTWSGANTGTSRAIASLAAIIRDVVANERPIVAFAVVESALFLRRITPTQWAAMLGTLPRRHRGFLSRCADRSESGGESLFRFALLAAGIPHAQQVQIPGVGRVDFLIGARLVIEINGAAYHTERERFENDHRRGARLSIRDYHRLQFSYDQVANYLPEVLAAVRSAILRGDHL